MGRIEIFTDDSQAKKLIPGGRTSLLTLALVFLYLGATAFGGPVAHIAMMENEFVCCRQWLSKEEFLDLLGITNLLPGPNSTEMAIHVGYKQAGYPGLLIAGFCFILPSACLVCLLALSYVQFGLLPQTRAISYGVKPVVIAMVVQAILSLAPSALKNKGLCFGSFGVFVLAVCGVSEIILLFGTGVMAALMQFIVQKNKEPEVLLTLILISMLVIVFSLLLGTFLFERLPLSLPALFLYFLKIGSILYGSGYVLLAFLRSDLVSHYHWITSTQLLDAVAAGQITPGPVFTTATFIGYILCGPLGAFLSTLGIFLPAFVFVALSGRLVYKMRQSRLASAFLEAVNAAALALMVVVTMQLAQAALLDFSTLVIGVVSAFCLVKCRINPVWLMLGGAVCGSIVKYLCVLKI